MKRIAALSILLLALATTASATIQFRPYTEYTGGGAGALDKTPIAQLGDGDVAFVAGDTYFTVHKFVASSTDAESSPRRIRPNDYSTAGVWHMIGFFGELTASSPSATPGIELQDSDTAVARVNGKIYLNCTNTGDGTENCNIYFQTMGGGTLATRLTIGSDGTIDLGAGGLKTTGAILGGMQPIVSSANPYSLSAANAYGSAIYYGATGTVNLPAGASGMSVLVMNTTAGTTTIDPNASEVIVRDGTTQTGGVSITLAGGAGKFVALVHDGTNWRTAGYSGTLAQGS